MAITFYWSPRSSAGRIYWALEELGIPFENVKVDLKAGDQRKPEYLAMNPNGKVPLLVDDGVPIFESMAILVHLGQRYGQDNGLWPSVGGKVHGQALSWVVWNAATLLPIMFRAKQADDAKTELEKLFDVVDLHLTKSPYFLGDSFTYVDLAIASSLALARMLGHDLSSRKAVHRWLEACLDRPAFKRSQAAQS